MTDEEKYLIIDGLREFMHGWCIDREKMDEYGEPAFRCAECQFGDGKYCSVKCFVKDRFGMEAALSGINHVIIMEETNAGIHEAVAWEMGNDYHFSCIDLRGEYVTHGSVQQLHKHYGMDGASIAQKVKEVLENEN